MSRILVVDDDPDMRALVGAYLKAAGHAVEFAEDGVAGAQAMLRQLPDLVVTDFQMPRLDGFGLFNAIRSDRRAVGVPVVMLTAHNSREMMLKALHLGLDDFLGKPVTQAELLRVVGERLKAPARAPVVAVPRPAPPTQPEFFGSVLCCEIFGVERFALALDKEELEEVLQRFSVEALGAIHRGGGWPSRPDVHHLLAAFEDAPGTGPAHAVRALRSALAVVLAAQRLKPWIASRFAGRDLPEFLVALGVHSGRIKTAPRDSGDLAIAGEAVEIATFLAESIVTLHWSVAASRATAKAAGFAFLAGRGAQMRMPNTGTVKVVEVKGLERPAQATAQPDRSAAMIEAAVDRNASLVGYAAAVPKAAAAAAPAAPGVTAARAPVPGYAVARKLAENGIVAAYLVSPEAGGPQEVLKTILVTNEKKRPHLQRFVDQYAGIAGVAHPNVARTTAQGLTAKHLYVVQEYCPGGDLRNLIAERMTADTAIKVLLRIAGGLKTAHQKGFIHGDLKPANVMIRADGSFALVDFALARIVEYVMGEEGAGVLVRSPDYLSPEMINGLPGDAQSDIYTLGLLLHEMLTGTRAYESPDVSRVILDHLNGAVPQLPAGLERLQPLLDKLMAKDRAQRFASVQEIITFMAQARLQA